jgi:hypothetical protein
MPYYITDESPDCSTWAVVKEDGEQLGCHATKQDAIDQMIALSIAEDIEPGGERKIHYKKKKMKRDLPDNYRPALAEDVPEGRACGNCFFYNEEIVNEDRTMAYCEKWEEFVDGGYYCNAWQADEEERAAPDALEVGDFVSWNSSGGRARGEIERIVRDGEIQVPNTSFTITGTEDDPAALIVLYREGEEGYEPTEIKVGHKFSTLTKIADLRTLEDRQVNLTPPAYMRAAARRGLELNRQGFGGDGLTDKTKQEAREMAAGRVSEDKWVRIAAWIARHLVDLDAPDADPNSDNYPSAGVVAHLLWGSGPSKVRAIRTMNYAKSVVEQLQKSEERHGTHDQSSHGNWSGGGGTGKNLLEDGTLQKGNSLDNSLSEKASNFKSKDFADGKNSPDLALQDLAERQKFTGKPQVASSQAEYDAIQSPKIESGPLKGQDVYIEKELHRGFGTSGDGKVSASTAKNEFEDGKYYAGKGLYGNGTYVTGDVTRAQKYAEGQSLENVSRFRLSPDSKIGSYSDLSMQLAENSAGSRSLPESIEFDVGRYALAQGFDGYVVDESKGGGIFVSNESVQQLVILNRTAIILPPKG